EERAKLSELQQVLGVDIQIATAELEKALIEVEQRQADLEDVQVRVPIAGQILKINTRIGEQVNTTQGIVELAQTDQMFAIAEVYETDITKIRLGQRATISSEYGGLQGEVHGTVDQIGLQIGKTELNQDQSAPTTDINARVVSVKIRLDRSDSPKVAALTGMQVRVKIDITSGESL
ncbi:MAG: HlyD family efflux transporter periplasmic adaptor subunit, partial [Microcoleus sp. SIO2G3]|nr:HlyD family efflux transporter periplasmic adaptor subunit [Microcoleus sp. SIO2G3]